MHRTSQETRPQFADRYRARRAELDRAAADAETKEQRKRRKVQLALAISVLFLVGLAAVGAWWRGQVRSVAAADRAARQSRTTAGVAAALRETRERLAEGWELVDYPERMQAATDAAVAAVGRADVFIAEGEATPETATEVADVRAGGLAEELPRLVRALDHTRMRPSLLFLEADDNALLRRFSETRRPHPLAPQGPVLEGVSRERALLGDLRALADVVFDTTDWSIHDTRAQVFKEFAGPGHEAAMAITLVSFGFKHGAPPGTDLLFDVRFLPNPYFVPELRDHSGQEEVIRAWLQAVPEYNELIARLGDLLLYLLPLYGRENRSYLSVGIGCTGGRHRSVAIAEALGGGLRAADWPVRVVHRDIGHS